MKNIDIPSINSQSENEINTEVATELLKSINISTPVFSLIRGVTSRIIKIRARHPEDEKILKEIELRQARIKNFNDFLNRLALAPFYGYVVHEKIYNEDFSLNRLEFIPYKLLKYDKDKGLLLKGKNNEIPITEDKFLISVYDKTIEKPLGTSLFEWGLKEVYDDLKDVQSKVRGLQAKYGGIIPILGYYNEELERIEPSSRQEYLKKKAESYKKMVGGTNVIIAPISEGVPLKDQISYVSLSDLKIDMHNILMKKYEEKIEKFIKGSTFSESKEGSQAKDRVQQSEKEKMEDSISKFISSELQSLIEDDAQLFGYSSECFYIVFELDNGELETEEIEISRVKTKKEKIEMYQALAQLGYKVSLDKISEDIGIEKKYIQEVPINIPLSPLREFSKDETKTNPKLIKMEELTSIYNTQLNNSVKNFTKFISEQIKEQIGSLKENDYEFRFNIDFSQFEDDLILGRLQGYLHSKSLTELKNYQNFNPFDMKFEEAIKVFTERTPILYETIEEITEEIRTNCFWLKRSSDLEITDKLFKSLKRNLEQGGTFKDWIKDSENTLAKAGLGEDGFYLDTVYRTNLQSQYSIGNYMQQMEVIDTYPYWQYSSVIDDNTSDTCLKLNGQVYKYDSLFWKIYYPPNHYRCRAGVISFSKDELEEFSLMVSKEIPDYDVGTFKGNPGENYWKKIKSLVGTKEEQMKLWE
ncbi:phage head morphogenesis protein [Cetobacterium sp.]|uniref:phage head morphogenesis protein n=1 Tax=Cetobacterium sp. TaxID=2071632 RepID=UPI003F67BF55